jgi:hypothetical protein
MTLDVRGPRESSVKSMRLQPFFVIPCLNFLSKPIKFLYFLKSKASLQNFATGYAYDGT